MIKANFNTYNNYVTDSLYQWDLNQDLIINGLNLSVAPEIHFANANMDRAIVRQSTISSGVVTVRIPNSLLQEALTIKAYVGVYEGDTFKIIETIEIPVIAKDRPVDYQIQDSDEEIYSFNRLENELANKVTYKDFESEKNNINNRISNIITHNNDTEGNTELLDIRTGYDGTVYPSAGDAVRSHLLNSPKTILRGTDLNNVLTVGNFTLLSRNDNEGGYYINAPERIVTGGLLIVRKWIDNLLMQIFINQSGCIFYRVYTPSWSDWYTITMNGNTDVYTIERGSDLNDFKTEKTLYLNDARAGDGFYYANAPKNEICGGIFSIKLWYGNYPMQIFVTRLNVIYTRFYMGTYWTDWERINGDKFNEILNKNTYSVAISSEGFSSTTNTLSIVFDNREMKLVNPVAHLDFELNSEVTGIAYSIFSRDSFGFNYADPVSEYTSATITTAPVVGKNYNFDITLPTDANYLVVFLQFMVPSTENNPTKIDINEITFKDDNASYDIFESGYIGVLNNNPVDMVSNPMLFDGVLPVKEVTRPFINKTLAITGDSITYGYDPAKNGAQMPNPWVYQVGAKLGFGKTINYAVSSGSLMDGADCGFTTGPMVLLDRYTEYTDDVDVFGFMIGINDAFRGYPLGQWGDTGRDTFYGALRQLCLGLIAKYPPKDRHKVFMILYPTYASVENWEDFVTAMKTTAEYFSIPYLDLSKEMGINIYSDTECIYWNGTYSEPTSRNAHPTQICADVIADTVANYVMAHFAR